MATIKVTLTTIVHPSLPNLEWAARVSQQHLLSNQRKPIFLYQYCKNVFIHYDVLLSSYINISKTVASTLYVMLWKLYAYNPHQILVWEILAARHAKRKTRHKIEAYSTNGSWWRHQMETFSALLAICAGNSPVPGEFPTQRPVTRSFGVFFDLLLNKRSRKQSWGWWFEMLSPIMTSM